MTVDSPSLLSLAELEELRHQLLVIRDHRRRMGTTTDFGVFQSAEYGLGMEAVDTRPYQHGDDTRHIDWRASARSGKPISKVFHKDLGRKLTLVIDRRPTMFFGTRNELKAATAARTAAILAYTALIEHTHVTAIVINAEYEIFPSIRNIDQLIPLLTALSLPCAAVGNEKQASLIDIFEHSLLQHTGGSSLYIISDFYDLDYNQEWLWAWIGQKLEVTALYITDHAEQVLQPVGQIRVRPPANRQTYTIDTDVPDIRQRYADDARKNNDQRTQFFSTHNIKSHTLHTDDDLISKLQFIL